MYLVILWEAAGCGSAEAAGTDEGVAEGVSVDCGAGRGDAAFASPGATDTIVEAAAARKMRSRFLRPHRKAEWSPRRRRERGEYAPQASPCARHWQELHAGKLRARVQESDQRAALRLALLLFPGFLEKFGGIPQPQARQVTAARPWRYSAKAGDGRADSPHLRHKEQTCPLEGWPRAWDDRCRVAWHWAEALVVLRGGCPCRRHCQRRTQDRQFPEDEDCAHHEKADEFEPYGKKN